MSKLNKMEVFRDCGFGNLPDMPNISFFGYDKVMDYCYIEGRKDINRIHITQDEGGIKNLLDTWELIKKVKDLETANARLFERNHELQVDNEESLKEVEEYSKRCDELRRGIAEHAKAYTIQKDTIEMCKQEIDYLHGCLGDRDRALLNLQNSVVGKLETSPKSKFVITVEEF